MILGWFQEQGRILARSRFVRLAIFHDDRLDR